MENAYGVGVKNRYELFYNEDVDPLDIIRQQEEEKEKRKTDKAHCKDKSKITKSGKQVSAALPKKPIKESLLINVPKPTESLEKTRARPFDRSTKNLRAFDDSKEAEDRKNFRNREDHQPFSSETRDREPELRRGRGGFRGRGRPRGRGNFFNNFEGRPRREFDRHSGSDKTGLRTAEKRDSAGSNNWGDMKSDTRKDTESTWMDEEFNASGEKAEDLIWKDGLEENENISPARDEMVNEKNKDDLTENMDSKENEPVPEERTEENMREMTLDEWKREQEAKRAVPKYNLRKPGEGEDGNQWKKLYMLKKKAKEDDDEEDEDDEDDVDDEEYARRGRHRQLVDIQINFNDSRRGRGRGRGVRGMGPRSGGMIGNKDVPRSERRDEGSGSNTIGRSYGRGNPKSSKSGHQSAPRVDDWNDFPSLVTV